MSLRVRSLALGIVVGLLLHLASIPAGAQDPSTPSPAPSPTTGDGGAGGDTAAIAINTKDGFDIFRVAFAIKRAMGDVVDNGNAAVAFASCTDCQTVAVSIQVVLMMNDPSIVTPTNLAIAINQECMLCETLAAAFQVILTTDGHVRFTPEGHQEIAAIRRELLAMRREGLTIEEILDRLDALMDRFFRVLTEELVSTGRPEDEVPTPTPTASVGASPSMETPMPTTSPSPPPSPSETPIPSSSP